ncbi:MAG TPA: acyltransferase [Flavisolibacter sp.]
MIRKRIELLDLFRFIAIILVIFYHYFAAFTHPRVEGNFYPYGEKYAQVTIFQYGFLGVEFFFIISGFVILMTLEKSKSISVFFIKRLLRLWPPILVCSILTFILVRVIDSSYQFPTFHRPVASFLPSLTFTEPVLWEGVFGRYVGYIDGVYWSLAVEVKFYVLAAILFFLSKVNFIRNWMVLTLVSLLVQVFFIQNVSGLSTNIFVNYLSKAVNFFLFPQYILFFSIGMLFYKKFMDQPIKKWEIILCGALLFMQLFFVNMVYNDRYEKMFILLFVGLFFLFIYRRNWLELFSFKILTRIGLASYSLYLIHQTIGILLIHYMATTFGVDAYPEVVVPVVILIMIVFSLFFFEYFEKRVSRWGRRFYR